MVSKMFISIEKKVCFNKNTNIILTNITKVSTYTLFFYSSSQDFFNALSKIIFWKNFKF